MSNDYLIIVVSVVCLAAMFLWAFLMDRRNIPISSVTREQLKGEPEPFSEPSVSESPKA